MAKPDPTDLSIEVGTPFYDPSVQLAWRKRPNGGGEWDTLNMSALRVLLDGGAYVLPDGITLPEPGMEPEHPAPIVGTPEMHAARVERYREANAALRARNAVSEPRPPVAASPTASVSRKSPRKE
jgi:hypothetical protein